MMGQTKITFGDIPIQKGGKWKIKKKAVLHSGLKSSEANFGSFVIRFQGLGVIICGSRLHPVALRSLFS